MAIESGVFAAWQRCCASSHSRAAAAAAAAAAVGVGVGDRSSSVGGLENLRLLECRDRGFMHSIFSRIGVAVAVLLCASAWSGHVAVAQTGPPIGGVIGT